MARQTSFRPCNPCRKSCKSRTEHAPVKAKEARLPEPDVMAWCAAPRLSVSVPPSNLALGSSCATILRDCHMSRPSTGKSAYAKCGLLVPSCYRSHLGEIAGAGCCATLNVESCNVESTICFDLQANVLRKTPAQSFNRSVQVRCVL